MSTNRHFNSYGNFTPNQSKTFDFVNKVQMPAWAKKITNKTRYHIYYGGRGSTKSWTVGTHLLMRAIESKVLIMCCREFQNKIEDSVHTLLSNLIEKYDLGYFFDVQKKSITGINGSQFKYVGLKTDTAGFKSFEGANIVWVEEAETVSDASWEALIPTLRAEGSQMYITFNPGLETSPTYQRFVVRTPKDSTIVKVNYTQNPWLTKALKGEILEMRELDYEKYLHVYEGNPLRALAGAVYEREIQRIENDGRLLNLYPSTTHKTYAFMDLGWNDSTCIWFVQKVNGEHHIVDYYENSQQKHDHYINYLLNTPYNVTLTYLPHDADNDSLTGHSFSSLCKLAGLEVEVIARAKSINDEIEITKRFLDRAFFDLSNTEEGFNHLRAYMWKASKEGQMKRQAEHNEHSHAADALRYAAIALAGLSLKGERKEHRRGFIQSTMPM